ncbi:MAG: hypothetical protein WD275_00845 [Rhodothermales bacterium]
MPSPLIGRLINCSTAALLGAVLFVQLAVGQPARFLQVGAAVIPGAGVQGGYIAPRSFFTVEGVVYLDGTPAFAGGEGSVQVSGGLGGAVRILGILRTIGSPGYVGRDFDFGMRFGPSLFFAFGGESSREENPFSLFLEPFLRATSTFGRDRIFYVELGVQRPLLRAGVWISL